MPSPAHIRSTLAALTAPPEELRLVAAYHKALSDPTRLRLMQRLAAGTRQRKTVRCENGPFPYFQMLGKGKEDNHVGTLVTIKGVKAIVAVRRH